MTGHLARSTAGRACAGLFAIALALPVHAQRNPATIPTRLAAAVLGGYGQMGWSPRFVVGRASADWPRALLPDASWTTVGAVEMGPLRVVVLDAPRGRDAMNEYLALLTRAGFREMPWARESGGFTASGTAPGRWLYCSDSSIVTVLRSDSTTRSLTVQLMRAGSGARCGDAPPSGFMSPLDIPTLVAPPGVSARRRSSGSGGDYTEQTAQLDTTISVAGALDHYSRQLAAAGWTVVGRPLVDGGTGLQRLSARDTQGTEWQGLLLAITTGSTRQLSLRMAKPEDERH